MKFPACTTLLVLLLALTGCGHSTFSTDISRFHRDLPPADGTATFTILPDDSQRGSLEFESYAQLVAGQMSQQGYQPVAATAPADLVVQFQYGIRGQHSVVETSPSTSVGLGYSRWPGYYNGWGWGSGIGMSMPLAVDTTTTTYYTRFFDLDIFAGKAFRQGVRQRVFEGRSISDGTSRNLSQAIPVMIRALFDGFPGVDGENLAVAVPLDTP